jgi:hypothetical protein
MKSWRKINSFNFTYFFSSQKFDFYISEFAFLQKKALSWHERHVTTIDEATANKEPRADVLTAQTP